MCKIITDFHQQRHYFCCCFRIYRKINRHNPTNIMAKPIKDTPTLTGKDAQEFQKNLDNAKSEKISSTERERMLKNFKAIAAIAVKMIS